MNTAECIKQEFVNPRKRRLDLSICQKRFKIAGRAHTIRINGT